MHEKVFGTPESNLLQATNTFVPEDIGYSRQIK